MKKIAMLILTIGLLTALSTTPSQANVVFHEDFNDNDISDWTQGSLCDGRQFNLPYVAGGIYYAGNGNDRGGHHKALDFEIIGTAFTIEFAVASRNVYGVGGNWLGLFPDTTMYPTNVGTPTANGYQIGVGSISQGLYLGRMSYGGWNLLFQCPFPGDQNLHNVKIEHLSDGSWRAWVDTEPMIPSVNVPDTFYDRFEFISTSLDPNDNEAINALDNIVVLVNDTPIADAGPNITITSEEQNNLIIIGHATDPDNDTLQFRWKEGETILSDWQPVALNGEAQLILSAIPDFESRQHTLTLEITDGKATSSDEMILTIDNSAPHAGPTCGGTYELFAPVYLGGQVADFDGDLLSYSWLNDETSITNGQIQSLFGGAPVNLSAVSTSFNTVGPRVITLQVNDGVNSPVSKSCDVNITDSTAPTLAPVPDKTILWPPNHKMVNISILANASDNSGGPVTLSATVSSNEAQEGLGDWDVGPDWTTPLINQQTGVITLQLRAERADAGSGRVYTIKITAADPSGNSSSADVRIIVPHDKGKK